MAKSKKDIDMSFQIKAIEILDIEIRHPQIKMPETTVFNYNINIQHRVNQEHKRIIVVVEIFIKHEDKKTLLGNLKTSCVFAIENFDELSTIDDNKNMIFPQPIIEILNTISISTVRGVMFSCFRGTFLHNAILPIIDPKSFKQDV